MYFFVITSGYCGDSSRGTALLVGVGCTCRRYCYLGVCRYARLHPNKRKNIVCVPINRYWFVVCFSLLQCFSCPRIPRKKAWLIQMLMLRNRMFSWIVVIVRLFSCQCFYGNEGVVIFNIPHTDRHRLSSPNRCIPWPLWKLYLCPLWSPTHLLYDHWHYLAIAFCLCLTSCTPIYTLFFINSFSMH